MEEMEVDAELLRSIGKKDLTYVINGTEMKWVRQKAGHLIFKQCQKDGYMQNDRQFYGRVGNKREIEENGITMDCYLFQVPASGYWSCDIQNHMVMDLSVRYSG